MVVATDEPRARNLVVPVRFEARKPLSVDRLYQLRIRKQECPKQFLGCASFPAVTFRTASSFIRPAVIDQLAHLEGLFKRNPEAKVTIFGHTDKVDDEVFNKKLSERRAWSAYAFIRKDADAWETLYNHDSETWGVPVIQEILADLGHDPGETSPKLTEDTKRAMREFLQLEEGAPVSNDTGFRRQLFLAYMNGKHAIELPEDCFINDGFMGCGEFNPIADTEEESETNRRVTFYFFHPERLPAFPCKFVDVAPCKRQLVSLDHRHKKSFGCSFYDSLACSCKKESIPLFTDLRILIAMYDGKPTGSHSANDWFHLTSEDGSVDMIKYASDAVPHKAHEYKIEFMDVRTHHKFTLRHYAKDASWTIFEGLRYVEMIDFDLSPEPGDRLPDQEGLYTPKTDLTFATDASTHLLKHGPGATVDDDSPLFDPFEWGHFAAEPSSER